MKPNLPGHCREACVFATTRLLAPTRRQHKAAHMKQICVHVLTKNTYYIWYFIFMNLTVNDNSTIQYLNCHQTQGEFFVLFIHYLNILFMLYIHVHFCNLYITIKMYRLSWISPNLQTVWLLVWRVHKLDGSKHTTPKAKEGSHWQTRIHHKRDTTYLLQWWHLDSIVFLGHSQKNYQ